MLKLHIVLIVVPKVKLLNFVLGAIGDLADHGAGDGSLAVPAGMRHF